MRAEKGGADRDRPALAEAARDAQRLALGRGFEAVARFDLDRRHAFGDQRIEPPQRRCDQLLLARAARRAHGGENAAAGAGDLLVARAGEPLLEFLGAVAAVDEMGVAIDEPGRDPAALAVDDARRGRAGCGRLALRAGEGDAAALRRDRARSRRSRGPAFPARASPDARSARSSRLRAGLAGDRLAACAFPGSCDLLQYISHRNARKPRRTGGALDCLSRRRRADARRLDGRRSPRVTPDAIAAVETRRRGARGRRAARDPPSGAREPAQPCLPAGMAGLAEMRGAGRRHFLDLARDDVPFRPR